MTDKYVLDGKTPVRCDNLMEWGRQFEDGNRHVADDRVGNVRVSTVFLGLDHNFGQGDPLLFETMVFGGDLDGECVRYATWEKAAEGHAAMIEAVEQAA